MMKVQVKSAVCYCILFSSLIRVHDSSNALWAEPRIKFLDSTGSKWKYQEDSVLMNELRTGLRNHHNATCNQISGKTSHPLFLVLGSSGLGKSRLLQEFVTLALKSIENETDALKAEIKNSYVFRVSFENATRSLMGCIGSTEIGTRMHFQLHSSSISWDDFRVDKRNHKTIDGVLNLLAALERKELQEMCVIILVDGLQQLSFSGEKKSEFYGALSSLATVSNASGSENKAFVICCVAATVHLPVYSWLQNSAQYRVFLKLPRVDGLKIFDSSNDYIKKMLVVDMEGHPRSLEILGECLSEHGPDYSPSVVVEEVKKKVDGLYGLWNKHLAEVVVGPILTGQKFENRDDKVGEYTVEYIEQLGLVHLDDKTKQLICPLVWLQLHFPKHIEVLAADPYLGSMQNYLYPDQDACTLCWQSWEVFVAKFFCMKTSVFDGNTMSWYDLHAGATFNPSTQKPPMVVVKKLQLVKTRRFCPTASSQMCLSVDVENGAVQPKDCKNMIVSAPRNPSGDSFCCMQEDPFNIVSFAVSCKNTIAPREFAEYISEYTKAACSHDFFMEYATSTYEFEGSKLPNTKCGFVCETNFKQYFGPFSGRAYFARQRLPTVCFLQAPRSYLEALPGIGRTIASNILETRKNLAYQNCTDLLKASHSWKKIVLETLVNDYCCQTDANNKVGSLLVTILSHIV